MSQFISFKTLYYKEVWRFLKVAMQTIVAPMVTNLLFLAVFVLALHKEGLLINGQINFITFLVPGLVMMAVVQNAFANTSSSLIIAKMNGNLVDVLQAPLRPLDLTAAYTLGAVTRGVMAGLAVVAGMLIFIPSHVHITHLWATVYFIFMGGAMLGLIGMLAGIWAEKFDHIATITNFVVTPLSFLSGTFYSIQQLPPFWHHVAMINPFFHMIDGLRYGMTGYADGNMHIAALVLLISVASLWAICQQCFSTGWRLKN